LQWSSIFSDKQNSEAKKPKCIDMLGPQAKNCDDMSSKLKL